MAEGVERAPTGEDEELEVLVSTYGLAAYMGGSGELRHRAELMAYIAGHYERRDAAPAADVGGPEEADDVAGWLAMLVGPRAGRDVAGRRAPSRRQIAGRDGLLAAFERIARERDGLRRQVRHLAAEVRRLRSGGAGAGGDEPLTPTLHRWAAWGTPGVGRIGRGR